MCNVYVECVRKSNAKTRKSLGPSAKASIAPSVAFIFALSVRASITLIYAVILKCNGYVDVKGSSASVGIWQSGTTILTFRCARCAICCARYAIKGLNNTTIPCARDFFTG